MKEKKDRVDDALRATRAAIEEGIAVSYTHLDVYKRQDMHPVRKGDRVSERGVATCD